MKLDRTLQKELSSVVDRAQELLKQIQKSKDALMKLRSDELKHFKERDQTSDEPWIESEKIRIDLDRLSYESSEYCSFTIRKLSEMLKTGNIGMDSVERARSVISSFWGKELNLQDRISNLDFKFKQSRKKKDSVATLNSQQKHTELSPSNLSNVKIAFTSLNDVHGQDAVAILSNSYLNLAGLVLCDGVTNASGELAAKVTTEVVAKEFQALRHLGNAKEIREQLVAILQRASELIRQQVRKSNDLIDSATTVLIAFTDGVAYYILYLGDGTIRHFTQDTYSVADYLLTYNRGGALQGFLSAKGIVSEPSFVYVDTPFTEGSFLVLGTDGAELSEVSNHLKFAEILKASVSNSGKDSLYACLKQYLEKLSTRDDDTTLGIIWINNVPRRAIG